PSRLVLPPRHLPEASILSSDNPDPFQPLGGGYSFLFHFLPRCLKYPSSLHTYTGRKIMESLDQVIEQAQQEAIQKRVQEATRKFLAGYIERPDTTTSSLLKALQDVQKRGFEFTMAEL